MAGYFLDSSAIAKFYHTEVGSATVERIVSQPVVTILISRLSVVEVQSAFAGKVRCGVISESDAASLRRRFLEDIATGIFTVVACTGDHYDLAGELIQRHGASLGLRTLDSLQLAVALRLHHAGAADNLVTADKILGRVGGVEGMSVVDPESPPPELTQ